jgi:hypothetical protein
MITQQRSKICSGSVIISIALRYRKGLYITLQRRCIRHTPGRKGDGDEFVHTYKNCKYDFAYFIYCTDSQRILKES